MPVFLLPEDSLEFPPPALARSDGLLAVGGDLSVPRLISAYRNGIFPWYDASTPILWWSPDPRMVLFPGALHLSRSLRKFLRSSPFEITINRAFPQVIRLCAETPRPGQNGTWLVPEMLEAYIALHQAGKAHSVEAWQNGTLAGGLYGVCLGKAFFGESMFHHSPNASKAALAHLVPILQERGCRLIDCQQETNHLRSLGAVPLDRSTFLRQLNKALDGNDML